MHLLTLLTLCCFSTGHQGRHGHEFLEFEYSRGRLRYANNSNYRNDSLIRKESESPDSPAQRLPDLAETVSFAVATVWISPTMVAELRRIVEDSEIMREDDAKWPKKNSTGRQELEVRLGNDHISFEVSMPHSQEESGDGKMLILLLRPLHAGSCAADRQDRIARRCAGQRRPRRPACHVLPRPGSQGKSPSRLFHPNRLPKKGCQDVLTCLCFALGGCNCGSSVPHLQPHLAALQDQADSLGSPLCHLARSSECVCSKDVAVHDAGRVRKERRRRSPDFGRESPMEKSPLAPAPRNARRVR
ncbi:hypothetical protein Golomagni_06267, partial [Golovinomyces magnicellulatus]